MNPQGHGQFLVDIARGFGVDIQIETVLAVGSLVAVAPFRGVESRIVDTLIAWMAELVADADTFPGHDGLWLFPAQIADRRCGIGYTFIDIYAWILCQDSLNLATLNGQNRIFHFGRRASQHCQQGQ